MIKPDSWIRKQCVDNKMVSPFVDKLDAQGKVSYGLSSYGYDIRVSDEYKIFTNALAGVVDPKDFDPRSFVDFKGEVCVIPIPIPSVGRTVACHSPPLVSSTLGTVIMLSSAGCGFPSRYQMICDNPSESPSGSA